MISVKGEASISAPNLGMKFLPVLEDGARIWVKAFPLAIFWTALARFSPFPWSTAYGRDQGGLEGEWDGKISEEVTCVESVKIFFGPGIIAAEVTTSLILDPVMRREISPPILVAAVIHANVPCVTALPSCSATTKVEALREDSFQKFLAGNRNIFRFF